MSLLTSLISYWTMDDSSDGATDIHGANTLSQVGSVGTASGKISTARDFPGTASNYFSHVDNADLSVADIDFTWAVWVKLDTKTSTRVIVSKGAASFPVLAYYLLYENGSDRFQFSVGNGTTNATRSANLLGSPSVGVWYYIVAWHDSVANTINIQVNNGGIDSTAYSGGSYDNADALQIGALTATLFNWDGLIDELGFWKRVLTAEERTQLYNGGHGRAYSDFNPTPPTGGLLTGLISYWKLDESQLGALDVHGLNPLTQVGTIGTASGKIGTARDLPGTAGNYFSHVDNADLSAGNTDWTFACWFRADVLAGAYRVLVDKGWSASGTDREWAVYWDHGSSRLFFTVAFPPSGSATNLFSPTGLVINTWYHLVVWHDSGNDQIGICIDAGTPTTAAMSSFGAQDSTRDFNLGMAPNYTGTLVPWDGLIDEAGWWRRVLTSAERTSLYGGGAGLAYPLTVGTTGKNLVQTGIRANSEARRAFFDLSGRIVAVGDVYDDGSNFYTAGMAALVARFTADGLTDITFSGDGFLAPSLLSSSNEMFYGAFCQTAEGKYTAGGHVAGATSALGVLARLNTDATFDTTFGQVSGFVWPAAATVTTTAATPIGQTTATLNGIVNPNGQASTVVFEYGLVSGVYNYRSVSQSAGSGSSPVAVSQAVTGLLSGYTYYYRCVSYGPGGTTFGTDLAFTSTSGVVNTLLSDTMTGPDGQLLEAREPEVNHTGNHYLTRKGAGSIQGNKAVGTGDWDVTINSNILNVDISGDFVWTSGGKQLSVYVRYLDISNYWVAYLDGTNFLIREQVAGTFTTRASTSFAVTTGVTYNIRVTVTGTRIDATVNGGSALSFTGMSTGGSVKDVGFGLFAANTSLDNLLIKDTVADLIIWADSVVVPSDARLRRLASRAAGWTADPITPAAVAVPTGWATVHLVPVSGRRPRQEEAATVFFPLEQPVAPDGWEAFYPWRMQVHVRPMHSLPELFEVPAFGMVTTTFVFPGMPANVVTFPGMPANVVVVVGMMP